MAILYSDINQYNPKTKPLLENVEAVYQSLYNLFGTSKGERPFQPEIGLDLDEYLFELGEADSNSFAILNIILTEIRRFEPRCIPNFGKSEVIPNYDNNSYELHLAFQILGLGEEFFEFKGAFFE